MSSKFVLLNYATGDFFVEYTKEEMEKVITAQMAAGNDLEDLELIHGRIIAIKEIPVFNKRYEIEASNTIKAT